MSLLKHFNIFETKRTIKTHKHLFIVLVGIAMPRFWFEFISLLECRFLITLCCFLLKIHNDAVFWHSARNSTLQKWMQDYCILRQKKEKIHYFYISEHLLSNSFIFTTLVPNIFHCTTDNGNDNTFFFEISILFYAPKWQ